MDIQKLIELSNLAKEQASKMIRRRPLYEVLVAHQDKTYLGVLGPRGTGKTILLKQLLLEQTNSIYLSLDTLESDLDLFELLKTLNQQYKFQTFYLDEVHYNQTTDGSLKQAFDFLDIKIV